MKTHYADKLAVFGAACGLKVTPIAITPSTDLVDCKKCLATEKWKKDSAEDDKVHQAAVDIWALREAAASGQPFIGKELAAELKRVERVRARIITRPGILGGRPHIADTPMPVATLQRLLAKGWTTARIVETYPYLTAEDVEAAITSISEEASDDLAE